MLRHFVRKNSVMTRKTIKVDYLARVEGESGLKVTIEEGVVKNAQLNIFEPPRFFEAFMRGRHYTETPDIVARICGICPVAYQMSAVHALENIFGVQLTSQLRALRRLLYCGEWIESHVLHIYMLHAPDFLGYEGAIDMARDHSELVRQGLEMKKIGNDSVVIMTTEQGRKINELFDKNDKEILKLKDSVDSLMRFFWPHLVHEVIKKIRDEDVAVRWAALHAIQGMPVEALLAADVEDCQDHGRGWLVAEVVSRVGGSETGNGDPAAEADKYVQRKAAQLLESLHETSAGTLVGEEVVEQVRQRRHRLEAEEEAAAAPEAARPGPTTTPPPLTAAAIALSAAAALRVSLSLTTFML
jgi:hypothetical protein